MESKLNSKRITKSEKDKSEVYTSTSIRRMRVINKCITASHANFTEQMLQASISEES